MRPLTVAIIFGGANSEHDVSCRSAAGVLANLDRERFVPVLIGIGRDGTWHRLDGIDELDSADRAIPFAGFSGVDVAIPVLHGRRGEDGTVQGLLELASIPYVGSGVLSSALCMDKSMCQAVLSANGIPVVPTVTVLAGSLGGTTRAAENFGFPVFVKPNRSGSSVGASRVDGPAQLEGALEVAFRCDSKVLIQPFVRAIEVDLGVIEHPDGSLAVGAPLRVHPSEGSDFFDFAAKYTPGGVRFEIPAEIDPVQLLELESLALRAFRTLDCAGLARVDFFLYEDGRVALNEINTLPGMTALSQFPRIWEAVGVGYSRLLTILVETALAQREPGYDPDLGTEREVPRSLATEGASGMPGRRSGEGSGSP